MNISKSPFAEQLLYLNRSGKSSEEKHLCAKFIDFDFFVDDICNSRPVFVKRVSAIWVEYAGNDTKVYDFKMDKLTDLNIFSPLVCSLAGVGGFYRF